MIALPDLLLARPKALSSLRGRPEHGLLRIHDVMGDTAFREE